MAEIISGIVTAIAIIILSRLLTRYITTRLFAATILVAIAFIYVGFSLKDNPVNLLVIEITFALALYFMATVGYTRNSRLIAYGIILHGIWDIFHHNKFAIKTDIPVYWPTYCFIIDIIDGLYFLLVFKRDKKVS
ncbi:MAG: hypothetical protein JNM88_07950 [Chitinophagaceae bacterium]|nr:hypothetical protein [Chitinophagaceae bacterium]